jgi:hypothetical protein
MRGTTVQGAQRDWGALEYDTTLYHGDYPAEADVQFGVTFDNGVRTGAFVAPAIGDVESGVTYGAAAEFTGTFTEPGIANVSAGVTYGAGGVEFTGTMAAGGGMLAANKRGGKQ